MGSVLVSQYFDYPRALGACVALHFHQHRIQLLQLRARLPLVGKSEGMAVGAFDVVPHAGVVFVVLDLDFVHDDRAEGDGRPIIPAGGNGESRRMRYASALSDLASRL